MKAKKSNGNGAKHPVGLAFSAAAQPEPPETVEVERPVGTVIKLSEEQHRVLATINGEVTQLKVQLGELAFAADDIERKRKTVVEQLRQKAEQMRSTAGEVVASYGIQTNNPSVGMWHVDVNGGKIERTA